jgi:VPDSG-CTERM motif
VTQLGLWDQNNDGLNTSHDVNIWTSTGMLLATTTIPSGTGATLTNGFRYVSIPSVLLPAGSYTIGGFYSTNSDLAAIQVSTITTASGVTYNGSRSAGGFVFPTGDPAGRPNSYFGPNFQFSVPDTGTTCSLLGLSLMGLAFLRRKLC